MSGIRQRQVRQVVCMNLWLIGACVVKSANAHLVPPCSQQAEVERCAYRMSAPVLMTQSPSSDTLMHWLASSNSKSWRSSTRLVYSISFLRLRFRFLASHSGSGRAVDEPDIVYTGTAPWLVSFIVPAFRKAPDTWWRTSRAVSWSSKKHLNCPRAFH